jgi:hypothetical protein
MMLTLCSHHVFIMFPMIFHDILNMFFKFLLYSLTHSQEHLTCIPYGVANVALSFIYIIPKLWRRQLRKTNAFVLQTCRKQFHKQHKFTLASLAFIWWFWYHKLSLLLPLPSHTSC